MGVTVRTLHTQKTTMTLRIPRLLAPAFATLALAFGGFAFAAPPQLLLPHDMPEEKAGKAEKSRAFSSEGHRVQLNRAFRDLKRGDAMQLTLPNGKSHFINKIIFF